MKIADQKTDADWNILRAKLDAEPTKQVLWEEAFDQFYMPRIDTRYLYPISYIEEHDQERGEGFSIVALFCTLVEFLHTCEIGMNFKLVPNAANHEYGLGPGSGYFKEFLRTRHPFGTLIPTHLVDSFYSDVRCGLLHEARTGKGWRIVTKTSNAKIVEEVNGEIWIYRDELVPALKKYFADYRGRLLADPNLQRNFLIKWNGLCSP